MRDSSPVLFSLRQLTSVIFSSSESEDIKWPNVQEKMPVISWDDCEDFFSPAR